MVTAFLSVRVADLLDPARYKPLLTEAMRGVVPDVTLGRVTKSDVTNLAVTGSRRHRDQIPGLVEDSHAAALDLVDLPLLRHHCGGLLDVTTPALRIEPFLGVESWLRTRAAWEAGSDVRVG